MNQANVVLCRPDARVVDLLRERLSPQYMKLDEIQRMLALDDHTKLDVCELLTALKYLEDRGEVQRTSGRGWRSKIAGVQVAMNGQFVGCQPRQELSGLAREVGSSEARDAHVVREGAAASNRGSTSLFEGVLSV